MQEMEEEKVEEAEDEGNNPEVFSITKLDLKILKSMWNSEGENGMLRVADIVRDVRDIDDRKDMMDKYGGIKHRMKRMEDMGFLYKEELDRGAEYKVSGDVYIGDMDAEMTYLGHTEEMHFDNVMFFNMDGVATLISLDNLDGV